jgi:hypothetical protein
VWAAACAAVRRAHCQDWLLLPVACLPILTGPLSPLLFTAIHSPGSSLLSFVVFPLSIIDTHNRLLQQSLHPSYTRPIRSFWVTKGYIPGRFTDQFHNQHSLPNALRFNTGRGLWASLIEPPAELPSRQQLHTSTAPISTPYPLQPYTTAHHGEPHAHSPPPFRHA